jgi:tetratricopeptide (TPR) repeat protein
MITATTGPMDEVYAAIGDEIQQRLTAATGAAAPDLAPVAARVLAIPPGRLGHPADAARFLHLVGFLSRGASTDGRRVWDWAKRVATPHPRSADVLGLLAATGDQLRQLDPSVADVIPTAELAGLFRRAMELAPDRATAFGRAGLFFLHQGDDAEAERCLVRAFALDPTSGFIARELADLYGHTDRPTDALDVLDRCVRASSPDAVDPEVLWKAGLSATSLGRSADAVGYLSQLERLQPGRRWVAYYRAIGLLETGRFAEAAVAIEREAGLIRMPSPLHVHAVRAAAAAGQGDVSSVRRHVDAAVRTPLSTVDYLAQAGVVGCYTRLWVAGQSLDADDTVTARLHERLLASGLTPAPFWAAARSGGVTAGGLTHYWCDLRQPLDARWAAAGHAMPGAERWAAYRIRYGVLASDPADAARRALDWQQRSALLPPAVERVAPDGDGGRTDVPGVTGRGYPAAAE